MYLDIYVVGFRFLNFISIYLSTLLFVVVVVVVYCALRVHVRCEHTINILLHYITCRNLAHGDYVVRSVSLQLSACVNIPSTSRSQPDSLSVLTQRAPPS